MVVRVRVRIKVGGTSSSTDLVVLASGGAESPRPCIVVGPEVGEALRLWPPSRAEVYLVEEVSTTTEAYLLPNSVTLELLDEEGNTLSNVRADLAIQDGVREPLITDITIDELGIQVVSFSRGLWRHRNDPPSKVRESPRAVQPLR